MGKDRSGWTKFAATVDCRRLGAIAVLLLDTLFLAAFLAPAKARQPEIFYRPISVSVLEPLNLRFEATEDSSSAKQAFYPYSVIPGGAKTPYELRNAVANDSVVRAHYADFVVANTRVERLEKTRAFYVSYRIGNAIFWTKNPLTVLAGETVLTDGSNMVRTRCGNRLSVVPVAPVSSIEPTPQAMESPDAAVLLASIDTPAELPIAPVPVTAISPTPVTAVPPGIFVPFPPYFPVGAGGSPLPPGTPGKPGPPTTPPPSGPAPPPVPPLGPPPAAPPPIATPEPSLVWLLAAGLSCVLLLKKLR
jgi:hypothetical protein